MIFYKITNYGSRFYIDMRLRHRIYDVIKPQVLSNNLPVFLVYYLSRDPDKTIPSLRQIALQRQPGISDDQLIEETVNKIIVNCKTNNELLQW